MVNFGAYVPNTSIANVTKLSVAFLHVVDDAKTDNSLLAEPDIVFKKQPFILGGDVKFLCFFNLMFDVSNRSGEDYISSGCSKSVKLKI